MALALPEPPWPASLSPLKVRGAGRGGGVGGRQPTGPGLRWRLLRSRCRDGGQARVCVSCRAVLSCHAMPCHTHTHTRTIPCYRTAPPYRTIPCRAVRRAQRCLSHSPSPLSLQAVDDLLRCGICFDYFSIAVIIPQCSHNCKCGPFCPLRSLPPRPAAPCPAWRVSRSLQGVQAKTRRPRGLTEPSTPSCG